MLTSARDPGCTPHPQRETNLPQLGSEFSELPSLWSALLNTKEVWRDRDLQMALRSKNSLSRLLTDKFALEKFLNPQVTFTLNSLSRP